VRAAHVARASHIIGGVNAGDLFVESGHGITVWVKSLGLVAIGLFNLCLGRR